MRHPLIRSGLWSAHTAAIACSLCLPLTALAEASPCEAAILPLEQAEQRLLTENHELRGAREAVAAARADLQTAGERPNPTLSVTSSGYDVRSGLGDGSLYDRSADTTFQLQQTLERGDKRGLRRSAADEGLRAAHSGLADQRRQSLLQLRLAYDDLRLAEQKLAIQRDIATAQSASVAAAEQRLTAGDMAKADVARLRVEALKADNDVRDAEAALHAARLDVSYLINCPAEATYTTAGGWPAPEALPPAVTSADRRPDVQAAEAHRRQAQGALDLAKSQQVRDVTLSVQYEHFPRGVPPPSNGNTLLGLGVSVPLFAFNTYEGEIARASADERSSEEALAGTRARAEAELAKARQGLAASSERARRFRDDILPQSQQAASAVEYAYSRGAVSLLDLLDARRTLHATRIDAATAQSDYAKALAQWQAATDMQTADASAQP